MRGYRVTVSHLIDYLVYNVALVADLVWPLMPMATSMEPSLLLHPLSGRFRFSLGANWKLYDKCCLSRTSESSDIYVP